jgi:hypothetical protein
MGFTGRCTIVLEEEGRAFEALLLAVRNCLSGR